MAKYYIPKEEYIDYEYFVLLTDLLVIRYLKRYRTPIEAIIYYRKKRSFRAVKFIGDVLEKFSGTGYMPIPEWLDMVSRIVRQ